MGFSLYLEWWLDGESDPAITPDHLRNAFGPALRERNGGFWLETSDGTSQIYVEWDQNRTSSMTIDRPMADLQLWDGVCRLIEEGNGVAYWPCKDLIGVTSVNTDKRHFSSDMLDAVCTWLSASSGEVLRELVRSS